MPFLRALKWLVTHLPAASRQPNAPVFHTQVAFLTAANRRVKNVTKKAIESASLPVRIHFRKASVSLSKKGGEEGPPKKSVLDEKTITMFLIPFQSVKHWSLQVGDTFYELSRDVGETDDDNDRIGLHVGNTREWVASGKSLDLGRTKLNEEEVAELA